MWLLDTSTIELKYFHTAPAGQYAILSHTWEDEEVSFQDIQLGPTHNTNGWTLLNPSKLLSVSQLQRRQGYKKILKTCQEALRDDLEWAWVDTCCINKESSAELTEAINSMYQWYADSAVCYAFLSDVNGSCPQIADNELATLTDADDHSPWYPQFRHSRYFTRSWTLQELIAPESVRFYGKAWNYIGSKKELSLTLWKATGIDPVALQDRYTLSSFAVARKMSWAARREATRIEDVAYSLLGIFGVNMPLLYGEGTKAFRRLQEEIVKVSTDHSVFAWEPASHSFNVLLSHPIFASSPAEFSIGRRITRWHQWKGYNADQAFHVSNRGVEFDGAYIAKLEDSELIILNCRFEDDLRGPLAIRIKRNDPPQNQDREFWLANPLRKEDRVTVYDWRDEPPLEIKMRQTWLQALSRRRFDAYIYSTSMPKFHLFHSPQSEELDVLDAHPAQMWNMEIGIMSPPAASTALSQITGSATVRGKISGIEFAFAFHASVDSCSPLDLPICGEHMNATRLGILFGITIARTQQQARSLLANWVPPSPLRATSPEIPGASASLSEIIEVAGDTVYVIVFESGHQLVGEESSVSPSAEAVEETFNDGAESQIFVDDNPKPVNDNYSMQYWFN